MREVRKKESGRVLSEDLKVFGQLTSSTVVPSGVRLILHGQIIGDLRIAPGGAAEIHGSVIGNVVNEGRLDLFGEITETLRDESGDSTIDTRARVGAG